MNRLLLAAEHPSREAQELGISLSQSPETARGKLRQKGRVGFSSHSEVWLDVRELETAFKQAGQQNPDPHLSGDLV